MKTIQTSRNVISLNLDIESERDFEKYFLLISDAHWDSTQCNRALFKRHLDQAMERKAEIFLFGDLFDAMQGRFDPRRSMRELRPEYRRNDYYDYIVSDFASWLQPYAANIIMISKGNHELAVLKNANTDLIDRLVHDLNVSCKTTILPGYYGGWVRIMMGHTIPGGKVVPQGSLKIKYYHGSGGEAPVTRGVIQTNRQSVFLPDADVVVNGHSHNAYVVPIARERISNKGVLFQDIQWHVRIPGYMQAYGDGSEGWEVERGGVPKPVGCVWMRLAMVAHTPILSFEADVQGADMIMPLMGSGKRVKVYEQDAAYP